MLTFVFGRSGYGKTQYCFSKIEELVKNGNENIILITPEQFNFTSERKLLTLLKENNVNKVENSSFSRLYNEITRLYGGNNLPLLSKGGKAVLMKKAISLVADDLLIFGKKVNSTSFVNSMVRMYNEMKTSNVSFEEMNNVSENIKKEVLSRKLHDISIIISKYESLIDSEYFDDSNEMSILYNKLEETDYLLNKFVIIDGFSGFAASEYNIIDIILKKAKDVIITLPTDSYNKSEKYDMFSYVNKTFYTLNSIANKNQIEINYVELTENFRAKSNELKTLEKYLYQRNVEHLKEPTNDICLYAAKNIYDECDFVSLQIKKALRNGYKAKEIAVVCRDLSKYSNQLLFSFKKYDIPFFDDELQPITTQPLIVFVQYLLRCVLYSFRSDDVLSLAKTGLTNIKQNQISYLENYIFLWNINGLKKWSKDFEESTKGFVAEIDENDQKKLDSINESRKILFEVINKFKTSIKNANAKKISESIYNTLIEFNVNKNLKNIAKVLSDFGKESLADEQGKVWDVLMRVLNELTLICSDEEMSINDYYTYFNFMISSQKIGVIPQGLDNVQIGQADRMRADSPKIVFVVGANENEFPLLANNSSLLSDSDRDLLSKNNLELYTFGEMLGFQERFIAYSATSMASEKLFVSYNGNCSNPSPSIIVSSLKELFVNVKEIKHSDIDDLELIESEKSAFELMAKTFNDNTVFSESLKKYFEEDEKFNSVKILAGNEKIQIKNKKNATKLFGKNMYLSASRIEDFFNCQFRYFCKFGLIAKPLQKAEINAMNTGVAIHFVLENLIKEVGSDKLGSLKFSQIQALVNKYLIKFLNQEMGNASNFSKKFKYQFMRISKMLYSVVYRLSQEFSQSDFKAEAFELSIDKDSEIKPTKIDLDDGGSVEIRGCIDRVDILEKENSKFIRVVDYKSGTKKFNLSDILYGLNLQMFVYLFTLCNNKNSKYYGIPAGVLYMHAARSVYGLEHNSISDSYSQELQKEFKMNGIVLYDENHNILESMEKDLAGKYIPIKISRKGDITGSFATLEQMGQIAKKVNTLIMQMGNSLHNGEVSQNPIHGKTHDKTCQFCDYSSVCANRRFIVNKEMKDYKDDEVMEILKEE